MLLIILGNFWAEKISTSFKYILRIADLHHDFYIKNSIFSTLVHLSPIQRHILEKLYILKFTCDLSFKTLLNNDSKPRYMVLNSNNWIRKIIGYFADFLSSKMRSDFSKP